MIKRSERNNQCLGIQILLFWVSWSWVALAWLVVGLEVLGQDKYEDRVYGDLCMGGLTWCSERGMGGVWEGLPRELRGYNHEVQGGGN